MSGNRYLPTSRGALQRRRRIAVYVFLGVVGMACGGILLEHIVVKNRIAALGVLQRDAEKEITSLDQEISSLNLRIDEQLSRKNLISKLAEHRTRLRPIQPGTSIPISLRKSAADPSR
jgi:hypothetical protein